MPEDGKDLSVFIVENQGGNEFFKFLPFRFGIGLGEFNGITGIEGNPEAEKLQVCFLCLHLGALQPADGPVQTGAQFLFQRRLL